ncbi:hypothetical protein [Coprococcus sp. AF102-57]|uniref:hypothetical protein n=1 Tax=Coprococcus sp. AF102-57 TaxID=2997946 RepID=UPI0022E8C0C6|nr:hypothetical protein [Coprococcus sp. AF102-57]
MDIITGYTGSPHVTAEQDRDVNIGIFGAESYVLRTGSQLKAEVSSNNEIKVRDGVIMHQGCAASIKKNTYDSLTIANGSQGMKRVDLIVARYSRDQNTKEESLVLKVIQGTPKESGPAVPGYTIGDIQAGDLIADMPLYQVTLNGLNITEVKQLFATQDSIAELSSNLTKANSKITTTNTNLAKTNTVLENRKPIIEDSTAQGTVNWDTNKFLKSGVTYAFVVTVSSNLNSENYKQEISCALNSVNMGDNGNYYKLTSTFMGKCSKGDKLHITSYKNGGTWTLFATRAIFIPVS